MTKSDWVIVWLSLQLAIMSWGWMRAEKKVSYLEGEKHAFADYSREIDGEGFDCSKQPCGKKGQ